MFADQVEQVEEPLPEYVPADHDKHEVESEEEYVPEFHVVHNAHPFVFQICPPAHCVQLFEFELE